MNKHQEQMVRNARSHRTAPAFSATFGVEAMESRQLMSAAPLSVGLAAPLTTGQASAIVMTKSPAATSTTTTTFAVKATTIATPVKSVDLQVTTTAAKSSGQTPVTPPPSGGTVEARSIWGAIKSAAKWVKDHVVIGAHKIGIKGTF